MYYEHNPWQLTRVNICNYKMYKIYKVYKIYKHIKYIKYIIYIFDKINYRNIFRVFALKMFVGFWGFAPPIPGVSQSFLPGGKQNCTFFFFLFLRYLQIWGVQNGPPHHPIPGASQSPPRGKKQLENIEKWY